MIQCYLWGAEEVVLHSWLTTVQPAVQHCSGKKKAREKHREDRREEPEALREARRRRHLR